MEDIETLLNDLRTVYAQLEVLRQMSGPEMLLPGRVARSQEVLEEIYAAYSRVETQVDELGQQLEYEHSRLDKEVKQDGSTSEDRA